MLDTNVNAMIRVTAPKKLVKRRFNVVISLPRRGAEKDAASTMEPGRGRGGSWAAVHLVCRERRIA